MNFESTKKAWKIVNEKENQANELGMGGVVGGEQRMQANDASMCTTIAVNVMAITIDP